MSRRVTLWRILCACAISTLSPLPGHAAASAQPLFSTTKVEGTDNVYTYRYRGHQSMFVVTADGVVVTDPQGFLLPEATPTYLAEIRKITRAPIRYVIYSHAHFDHIAGGQPFKDEGAVFIAHRRARERLEALARPDIVLPDLTVDDRTVLTVGGMQFEISYVGRSHSDNMLVVRLPKERILFAVDWIPVGQAPPPALCLTFFCVPSMSDYYPLEYEEALKKVLALEWDRYIPGHPGPRLGTRADVSNLIAYMTDIAAVSKQASAEGRCNGEGQKALPALVQPKYPWAAPERVEGNLWRYCLYWGQGY